MSAPARGWRGAGAAAVLLSGSVLMAITFIALTPVLPQIATHFAGRGGIFASQMIASTAGLGVIAGGLFGGPILLRLGIRRGLFAALLIYALSGASVLLLDDVWSLLAARFVLGLSVATAQTALVTLISTTYSPERRVRLIGYGSAIGYGGAVIAVVAAGAVGQIGGWRAPGLLYLAGIVVLVMAAICLPRDRREPAPAISGLAVQRRAIGLLWPIYLLAAALYTVQYMSSFQLVVLNAANGVKTPAGQSMIMLAGALTSVVSAALTGPLRQRLGQARLFALVAALLGIGDFVIGLSHGAALTMIGGAIAGLGGGLILPLLLGAAVTRAPDAVRSSAIGLVYTAAYVGEFLCPVLTNPLRVTLGIHALFLVVGGALALIGLAAIAHSATTPSGNRQQGPAGIGPGRGRGT